MNVLLFSMPDSFEHTPSLTMRMPNGALASLAGNVDPHHKVAVADLILAQKSVPQTVTRLVTSVQPDVVGLSVMTFQRKTALKVIALVRALRPNVVIVVGGYDASLAPEHYEDPASGVDFIVSGEGDAFDMVQSKSAHEVVEQPVFPDDVLAERIGDHGRVSGQHFRGDVVIAIDTVRAHVEPGGVAIGIACSVQNKQVVIGGVLPGDALRIGRSDRPDEALGRRCFHAQVIGLGAIQPAD